MRLRIGAASKRRPNGEPARAAIRSVVRFGVFELDTRTGELRKHGVKLKLQAKPLQVLQALLEHPGEVVTREELRRRLWSEDVFVDFESGLNTAANRLRITLGDSAESPRYIETLARIGYRFIAPIALAESSAAPEEAARPAYRKALVTATVALTVTALGSVAYLASRGSPPSGFQFQQITFRRGQIWGSRFAPDGHAILYTANWDNGPRQLFLTNPFSPESRPLGFDELRLVSVSSSGELALMSFDGTLPIAGGTLSRVPMNGGTPLPVERNITSADWSADGRQLAIVRAIDGVNQLEFPAGKLLYKTSGSIGSIRVSPDNRIALIEHPIRHNTGGHVKLAEIGRPVRTLSEGWIDAGGVAWHPSTKEIWFTASRDSSPKSLWAVTEGGTLRHVTQIAGAMTLRDIAPDGRALVSRDTALLEMAALRADERAPRNLSWLDWSRVADVSNDGRLVLFDETGVAGSPHYLIYVHRLSDGATMRIGEGRAMALSPDGKFVLALGAQEQTRFRLVPLKEGKPIDLAPTGLEYQWARYFPDGQRLIALANEPGQPLRLYIQPLSGRPVPITPPMVIRNLTISPDGSKLALLSADGRLVVYPTDKAGAGRTIPTTEPLAPLLWKEEDWLYVQHVAAYTQIPTRISRLHLPTGRLEPWREVAPADPLGVNAITKVVLSQDAGTVVFNYRRVLSELFLLKADSR